MQTPLCLRSAHDREAQCTVISPLTPATSIHWTPLCLVSSQELEIWWIQKHSLTSHLPPQKPTMAGFVSGSSRSSSSIGHKACLGAATFTCRASVHKTHTSDQMRTWPFIVDTVPQGVLTRVGSAAALGHHSGDLCPAQLHTKSPTTLSLTVPEGSLASVPVLINVLAMPESTFKAPF